MHAPGIPRPLVLAPFRGLRFDPAVAGDLGTVVSPPYDVLDADTVRRLEETNPHNIVRLILSRRFEAPYQAVLHRLDQWRAAGLLVPDPEPTLYVYEYTAHQDTVRGLIGLLGLRDPAEGVVLPHEDVMPGPVADREILMRTTRTNLEPILLVHQGTRALRRLVDRAAAGAPWASFTGPEGTSHRLWGITDPGELAAVAAELAGDRALIADGHHRYTAYQRLEAAHGAEDDAWSSGLAMLVDQDACPLQIGPIHRSVNALTMTDVCEASEARGDQVREHPDLAAALADADADPGRPDAPARFVLADGRRWVVLETSRTHDVDAAVLHETLLPAWNVDEAQVGYHHSLDQALRTTARRAGIVVALRPPRLDEVMATAARGERMPRKSTSFFPKPAMGVVMRDLRDG